MGKFICAVAVLRLIQEWNSIMALPTIEDTPGHRRLAPGVQVSAGDAHLVAAVLQHHFMIDLDTQVMQLIEGYLDQALIAGYATSGSRKFPGVNVSSITIGQLLNHTSGMGAFQWFNSDDLGGVPTSTVWDDVLAQRWWSNKVGPSENHHRSAATRCRCRSSRGIEIQR